MFTLLSVAALCPLKHLPYRSRLLSARYRLSTSSTLRVFTPRIYVNDLLYLNVLHLGRYDERYFTVAVYDTIRRKFKSLPYVSGSHWCSMIYTLSVTTKTLHDVGHNVGHSELFSFPEMEQFQSYNNKQPCSERSQSKHQSKVIPVETFCVIFVFGGRGVKGWSDT